MAAPGPRCAATTRWRRGSTPRPTQLATRFEEAFWMEDRGYYAMALDGDKRQADAIGSERRAVPLVGHRRARSGPGDVVERLLQSVDVLGLGDPHVSRPASRATTRSAITRARSGRTTRRSSRRASSGTASTRRRTAWSGQMIEAAQRFPDYRLPELFCGFDRDRCADRRCRTRSRARRRPGPPGRRSCSSRRCSGLRAHADRGELELLAPAPARLAAAR